MNINNPTGTIMYLIEHAIKEYRKYSQKNINEVKKDITVDQCLVLIILNNNITSSQKEIAELIFKDYASLTRMIELMVKKRYLIRTVNLKDRRKSILQITSKGQDALKSLGPKILENRRDALKGISDIEIKTLEEILVKIISNCKN